MSRFIDACRNFACGTGEFIGGSHNALSSARKALRKSVEKLRPKSSKEKIRSVVTEELIRLVDKETELTQTKLEKHLQVMAEAISVKQTCGKRWGHLKPPSPLLMMKEAYW